MFDGGKGASSVGVVGGGVGGTGSHVLGVFGVGLRSMKSQTVCGLNFPKLVSNVIAKRRKVPEHRK